MESSVLTVGSILILCLAGASMSESVEADARVTLSGLLELSFYFLRAHLSIATCVNFSSPDLRCLVRVPLHFDHMASRLPQDSVPTAFMLHFTTSWYRSCGHPAGLLPVAISTYRRSLGMRPFCM